jgi:hypothetical protein
MELLLRTTDGNVRATSHYTNTNSTICPGPLAIAWCVATNSTPETAEISNVRTATVIQIDFSVCRQTCVILQCTVVET